MICPACKSEMIDIEYDRIELDYCTGCKGVWFDSNELELLLEAAGMCEHGMTQGGIINAIEAKTSEKERKCPICNRGMKKTAIGAEHQIIIDACRKGDGLWFDGGELAQLLEQMPERATVTASQQKVMDFLEQVFQAEK